AKCSTELDAVLILLVRPTSINVDYNRELPERLGIGDVHVASHEELGSTFVDELFNLIAAPLDGAGNPGVEGGLGGHGVEAKTLQKLGFSSLSFFFERFEAGGSGKFRS